MEKSDVRGVIVAVSGIAWTTWLPIIISALALLGTLGNLTLLLWRGRAHLSIRSAQDIHEHPGLDRPLTYICRITNVGYVGVQIDRVKLRRVSDDMDLAVLGLRKDELPRKLDQGESQVWGMYVDEIGEHLPRSIGVLRGDVEVVAVAIDTTGKEYLQKREDSLSIRL